MKSVRREKKEPKQLPESVRERWAARREEYERENKMLEEGSSDDTLERLIEHYPGLFSRST